MSNEKHTPLKPTSLRLLLILALFGVVLLTTAGFVFAQQKLSTYAVEVSHKKIDASASKASLQTLQSIEKQLIADKDTVEKAKVIKHSSSLPQFKAIDDLKNHAAANNISIGEISFVTASSTATPASSTPAAPLTTPVPVVEAEGVDISFKINDGQVNVNDFVRFLYDIEHSTPKMQIKGISVNKASSSNNLTVDTMTVRMFTKST
jgi:hypothetical protein